MKTTNFNMQLMIPGQANKDIIFNESLLKIDSIINLTINSVIDHPPEKLNINEKYLVSKGKHQDKICYISHKSKAIEFISPFQGMMVFALKNHCFLLYENKKWSELKLSDNEPNVDGKFTGIDGEFIAPPSKSYLYLYLNTNTSISLDQVCIAELTIMIKQCSNNSRQLTWPNNILWEKKVVHSMTKTPNATDIVKFFRLPETTHFLGKIIAKNYQF